MKKLIPTLVFLLCLNLVSGQVERDKVLHFVGGNLYGLAGAGIAKKISKGNRWWTFAGAIGGSTLVGLGKEAIDASQRENGWDNDDLWATILGGAAVGVVIDIAGGKKRKRFKERAVEKSTTFYLDADWSEESINFINDLDRLPTLTELAMPKSILVLESD